MKEVAMPASFAWWITDDESAKMCMHEFYLRDERRNVEAINKIKIEMEVGGWMNCIRVNIGPRALFYDSKEMHESYT